MASQGRAPRPGDGTGIVVEDEITMMLGKSDAEESRALRTALDLMHRTILFGGELGGGKTQPGIPGDVAGERG